MRTSHLGPSALKSLILLECVLYLVQYSKYFMCVANIVYYGYLNVFLKHLIIHK